MSSTDTTTARAHALLVVDLQRGVVVGDDAVPDARRVIAAVECQLESARAAGCLVVHLQNDGDPEAADAPGSPGRVRRSGTARLTR